MSSALSESVTYDAAIVAPDDGDPRTAASIRTPLGQLADRTLYTKRRVTHLRGEALAYSADPATDLLTAENNGLATNDLVTVESTGTAPGGLTVGTTYYWNVDDDSNGYLSATLGGGKIDITTTGTGTQTIRPIGSSFMWLPVGAGEASLYPDGQSLRDLLLTIAGNIQELYSYDEPGKYTALADTDQTLAGESYYEHIYKVGDPAAARTHSLTTSGAAAGRIVSFVMPRAALTNSVTLKRLGSGNTLLVFGAGCTGGFGRLHYDGSAWHVLSYGGSSVTLGTDY